MKKASNHSGHHPAHAAHHGAHAAHHPSNNTIKALRNIARVLSVMFIGFALMMFIGYAIEGAQSSSSAPLSLDSAIQLGLFGLGLLGLALAWKWEMAAGVLSLLSFAAIFIINNNAASGLMFIFPANAMLFMVVGFMAAKSK